MYYSCGEGFERVLSTPGPDVTVTMLRFTVDHAREQQSFLFGSDRLNCDVYVYGPTTSQHIFAVSLQHGGRSAILRNLTAKGLYIASSIYGPLKFKGKRVLHPGDKVGILFIGFQH